MDLKTLPPTEQLDFVLNYIRKQSGPRERNPKRFHDFCKEITNTDFPDHQAIRSILDRLKSDNYIQEAVRNYDYGGSYHMFAITFDGEALLDSDGGYSGKMLTSQAEHENSRKLERGNHKLQRYAVVLAFFGVLLAAAPFLKNLWGYFFVYMKEHYPHFPCWECLKQIF